ncbi:MAG: glycosyltransferase family 2 protein [bacterium]|nr:glycosyltransferase family 2 protein [bacterium]
MTKVSYLIVAYRSKATIAALLDSIDAQQGDFEREVIIVDNSPAENCAELVGNRNVRYILNQQNTGYTRGTNQAIAAATGDVIFLLNPDVRLIADCTAKLLAALDASTTVAASAPQLLNHNGSIQHSVRNFPTFSTLVYDAALLSMLFPRNVTLGHWRNRYFDHNTAGVVQQPMASALMLKRDVITRLGPLDEKFFIFFSDVDYCKRIADDGLEIRFVPEAKAHHLVGGSTRQEGTWLIWDSHCGFYRYLAKHELLGAKVLLRPLAAIILGLGATIRTAYRKFSGQSF